MKSNVKTLLKLLAMLLLLTVAIATFAACGGETPPDEPPPEDNPPAENPPSEDAVKVHIIERGVDTDYVIIYSSNGGSYAYSVKEFITSETTAKSIEMRTDDTEYDYEILVGNTGRQLSKDLKAYCEEKYADDSHVWGYAYRDGKFAFYFNTNIAFEKGLEKLEDLFIEKRAFTVMSNEWQTFEYSAAEYEADKKAEEDRLKAEEEAKKKAEYAERLTAAKKENSKFLGEEFGVTENWLVDYSMPSGVYNAPKTEITASHPRVLLNAEIIEQIKLNFDDPEYEGFKTSLLKLADSKNFTGIFPEKTHKTGETYRYDETILGQIEARAMMYLITGEECYGYEAIMGIKNAMLSVKYTVENHMDVFHGPGHVMAVLAYVYDWCYPLLSEEDKAQMISGCVYLLIEAKHLTDDDFVVETNKPSVKYASTSIGYGLELKFPPTSHNAITGHGPETQFLGFYMLATMAFADEMPSWWTFVGGRYYEEFVPAAEALYQNGFVPQGTSCYAPERIKNVMEGAYLVQMATGENPFPDNYFAECANFMLSQIMGNGKWFETGDGPRTGEGSKVVFSYLYYFAAMYNDTFSLTAAKYYSNNYTVHYIDGFRVVGPGVAFALASACDKPTGNYPDDMPLITYTGYPAGQTTIRNSWDSDAAVVFMKINEHTLAAHDTMDSGTFQIYYKGFLACTSGTYKSYGSNHHEYYLQATVSMNGLLIYNPDKAHICNGWYSGSQNAYTESPVTLEKYQSSQFDTATVTGVENAYTESGDAHYAYLAGDLTKSYDADTVNTVERRMLTVYTGDESFPMIMFVYDNITADEADYKKSFLLHTVNEPTVGTNDDGQMYAVVTDGEGKLVLTNVAGGDHIYAIGGEGYAYWVGNENEFDGTANSGKNFLDEYVTDDNSDTIWGRVEITANGERTTKMLNTMYVTDAGTTEVLESVAIETDTVLGATVGGNVTAVFVKNINRATDEITFSATGDEDMKYYISGVTEGTWEIYVNGVLVGTDEATADGGFLYFEASAGEITLKPVTE